MMNTANDGEYHPFVSIVIPTRNEADDIAATLDRCLALDYDRKEIIVVDDSTDNTPAIVSAYADRGVRLIHREENRNGCCGARNLGMQQARGEIIVLFNADDRPCPDFLRRVLPHYAQGADYVVVRSVVAKPDSVWGKYTWAAAQQAFRPDLEEWSEGFSCRKDMAARAGYIPGDFPVPFCRDFMFGPAMTRAGAVKHNDMTIRMEHIVPDTLAAYWRNQVWRGTFAAPYAFYFCKRSVAVIWARELLKTGRTVLRYGLIIPALWRAVALSHFAPQGRHDLVVLIWVGLVQEIALRVGNFKGLRRLMQVRQSRLADGVSKTTWTHG